MKFKAENPFICDTLNFLNDLLLVEGRWNVSHVYCVLGIRLGHFAPHKFERNCVLEARRVFGVVNGSFNSVCVGKVHKTVTFGLPCLSVPHNFGAYNCPVLGKLGVEVVFLNV